MQLLRIEAPGGKLTFLLLVAPAALWLTALIIAPHIQLFIISFHEPSTSNAVATGLSNYREFFVEPLYWRTFARTAIISIITTILAVIIGLPVSYYIAKLTRGYRKSVLFVACLLPFWVSELVRTLGWMILLRETGVVSNLLQVLGFVNHPVELLYNDATIIVGLVYTSILFMVVPLVNAFDSLDDSLVEAGYDLGGNIFSVTWDIIIPHAMPGLMSGCIVVFMLSLGNYATPTLLGGKNSLWFTEQIYAQFITRFNWEQGAAFGFLLLILSSAIIWLALRITRQRLVDVVR
ncbi:MAG: ABC transporter permease [Alphaproteobacteria bacterium]